MVKSRLKWWSDEHWNLFAWAIYLKLSGQKISFERWLKECDNISDLRQVARMKVKEYENWGKSS